MYAAHAEQSKKETSKSLLEKCIQDFKKASNDSELFANLLEISQYVRGNDFTQEDQRTVMKTVGVNFLSRLLNAAQGSNESHIYKSIALSFFATLSSDHYMKTQPEVKDFLLVVNTILQQNTNRANDSSEFKPVCEDCEEIVSNLAQEDTNLDYFMECGASEILINYVTSPHCQNPIPVLRCLSLICKKRGDSIFSKKPDQFHIMMSLIVERIEKDSDLTTKVEYASTLTAFLSGISDIELSIEINWVLKLLKILNKFISIKISPHDGEVVLFLVCALVSAVGPEVLKPQLVGGSSLIKAVVARVSVEVYMMLDNIDSNNALERYLKLDKVYKLLCDLVHYLSEFGEGTEPDSIIVMYKKLVEITENIMEFLNQVWNQIVDLPKNHIVVLISVRTLAAMLSEITEDPTEQLLELIPFFNFLCQNVEYSEDVIMEVKSATQAALENIRLLEIADSQDVDMKDNSSLPVSLDTVSSRNDSDSVTESQDETECSDSHFINRCDSAMQLNDTELVESDSPSELTTDTSDNQRSESQAKNNFKIPDYQNHTSYVRKPDPHITSSKQHIRSDIHLSPDDLQTFMDYQAAVTQLRSKPSQSLPKKVSFTKQKSTTRTTQVSESPSQTLFWRPLPDDILGYLIPFYGFLLDSQEALGVMVKNDCFSTVVSFIERSLSQLLENRSTLQPENVTVNALSVVEQIYTSYPATVAELMCFQSLFEISVLSIPNLLSLPHPPPLVSLKFIEVCLTSYRIQMRGNKRNPSLQRLKHSQARLFKALVDYLSTFYTFRTSKRRPVMIYVTAEYRDVWPLSEEIWCGCMAGLAMLLRSVEELQDILLKSVVLPDFLDFLKEFDDEDLKKFPDDVKKIVDSVVSLIESAAECSTVLQKLILQYDGKETARQLKLNKLQRLLDQ
ncbi:hypothetical protein Btru_028386 [Bulinus truncatus]|nr:hypothetical protein Btru_028386 [Bulinus truncatus]